MTRLPKAGILRNHAVFIILIVWVDYSVLAKRENLARQFWGRPIGNELNLGYPPIGAAPNCPLCDSSVYSYCSHKLEHDACCCGFPVQQLTSYPCASYNCSLLYAKSCYEHALIKNCCCSSPF